MKTESTATASESTHEQRWHSVADVARIARIGENKVHSLIKRGFIAAIDIGQGVGRRQLRITPDALAEFVRRMKVQPSIRRPRRLPNDGIDRDISEFLDSD